MLEEAGIEVYLVNAKLGRKGAVVANAHKLTRIIYTMIRDKVEYNIEIMIES